MRTCANPWCSNVTVAGCDYCLTHEGQRHAAAVDAANEKSAWCRQAMQLLVSAPVLQEYTNARQAWLDIEAIWDAKPDHL